MRSERRVFNPVKAQDLDSVMARLGRAKEKGSWLSNTERMPNL